MPRALSCRRLWPHLGRNVDQLRALDRRNQRGARVDDFIKTGCIIETGATVATSYEMLAAVATV